MGVENATPPTSVVLLTERKSNWGAERWTSHRRDRGSLPSICRDRESLWPVSLISAWVVALFGEWVGLFSVSGPSFRSVYIFFPKKKRASTSWPVSFSLASGPWLACVSPFWPLRLLSSWASGPFLANVSHLRPVGLGSGSMWGLTLGDSEMCVDGHSRRTSMRLPAVMGSGGVLLRLQQ